MQDAVRILADWLRSPVNGLAAQLALVPLESGVARLSGVTITDECTDKTAALQQVPDGALPVLQVMRGATLLVSERIAVRPWPSDGTVRVGLRYVAKNADTRALLQQADQVSRAARRSLGRILTVTGNEISRVRNQIQLLDLVAWDEDVGFSHEDTLLTCTMVTTVRARDVWAATP